MGALQFTSHRRLVGIVGMAIGAALASPLTAIASADPNDVVTHVYGPYDGFTDTVTSNSSTDAFDSFLTGTSWGDLDVAYGGLGSGSSEVLLTDPGMYQIGYEEIAGHFSFIDIMNPADFVAVDPGLADVGGLM